MWMTLWAIRPGRLSSTWQHSHSLMQWSVYISWTCDTFTVLRPCAVWQELILMLLWHDIESYHWIAYNLASCSPVGTAKTVVYIVSGLDPCRYTSEAQAQFPSGMCLYLWCHSSGKTQACATSPLSITVTLYYCLYIIVSIGCGTASVPLTQLLNRFVQSGCCEVRCGDELVFIIHLN